MSTSLCHRSYYIQDYNKFNNNDVITCQQPPNKYHKPIYLKEGIVVSGPWLRTIRFLSQAQRQPSVSPGFRLTSFEETYRKSQKAGSDEFRVRAAGHCG